MRLDSYLETNGNANARRSGPVERPANGAYTRIDNAYYDSDGGRWWQPDSPLYLIHSSVNPARMGYFQRNLFSEPDFSPTGKAALDVGCGGGFLSEQLSRMGFDVTGIDPSLQSLQTAANHAGAGGLPIKYTAGSGEALPFLDNSFDYVFCCDVLEHVSDLPKVVSEIARVLKPGGFFCFDTFNRTLASRLAAIHLAQTWKRWAFAPPNLHNWEMFIKPGELKNLLASCGLAWQEHKGLRPNVALPALLKALRKRARGIYTYGELGQRLCLTECNHTRLMYMGYAVKNAG